MFRDSFNKLSFCRMIFIFFFFFLKLLKMWKFNNFIDTIIIKHKYFDFTYKTENVILQNKTECLFHWKKKNSLAFTNIESVKRKN